MILAYPTITAVFLVIYQEDFDGNVIEIWEQFEGFYMLSFTVIAIMLLVSTLLSLSHMRRVFG